MTNASRAMAERLVGVGFRVELSLRAGGIDSREELRGAGRTRYSFYITTRHDLRAAEVVVRPAD